MGKGKWTRWGRGSCEGYSLEIGWSFHGQVVRNLDCSWRASLNTTELDVWKTKEEAMRIVEQRITRDVRAILEDWALWETLLASSSPAKKSSSSSSKPRTPGQTDTP